GERNLLEPEEFRIAEETNRARDHFVHFEVRRFQLPPVLRERCDQRGRVSSLPPRRHNVRRERPVPELLTKAKRTIPPPASGTPSSASTRPARDAADAMERRGSSSVSSSGGRSRSGARSDARGGSTTRGSTASPEEARGTTRPHQDPSDTTASRRPAGGRERRVAGLGRPYATGGGKSANVCVQRVDNATVVAVRVWGAHERVAVKRE